MEEYPNDDPVIRALREISGLGLPTYRTQQQMDRLRGAIAEMEYLLRYAEGAAALQPQEALDQ